MSAAVSSTVASSGINAAAAAATASSLSAAPSRSPSKASALLTGGPPRPIALRKTSRSASIITPTSTTLLNASVVQKDEETGEESHLRPLSDADVLCGRGGLVNGFIGNIAFRELVAEHRDEYRDAKKKAKALIAQGIVDKIKSRGGLFLHRVDIDNDGGKGTGTHKNNGGGGGGGGGGGDGSPSKSKGGTGMDAQGSKWADISEGKAREKTSQALREGAEVRKSSIGNRSVTNGSENGSDSLASATKAIPSGVDPPLLEASASKASSTASRKSRKKRKSESSTSSSLTSFLPPTVAVFLEEESTLNGSAEQDEAIKSPDDFARIVSKPRDGKQRLAQRLFDWNATRSASDQSNDWMAALGTVDLWRRQVDVWVDALAYFRSTDRQQKQQDGDGPGDEDDGDGGTSKKAKTTSQESAII